MKLKWLILTCCLCVIASRCTKEKTARNQEEKEPFEGYFFIRTKIDAATDVYLHAMNVFPLQDTIGVDLYFTNDTSSTENLWIFSAAGNNGYSISPYKDSSKVFSSFSRHLNLVPRSSEPGIETLFSIDSTTESLVTFRSLEDDKYITFQYCEKGWSA